MYLYLNDIAFKNNGKSYAFFSNVAMWLRIFLALIHEAEGYDRGFYTGIMGIYNNGELNSAVMIRFLENDGQGTYFKAYRQGFFLPCHSRRKLV